MNLENKSDLIDLWREKHDGTYDFYTGAPVLLYPTVDQPFSIKSYGFELEYPINPDLDRLPSLTLTYGGFREGQPGLVQAVSTIFTLTVYATVKKLSAVDTEYYNRDGTPAIDPLKNERLSHGPRNLFQSCSDMHSAMISFVSYLNMYPLGDYTGEIENNATVDRVKLARGRSGEGKFTEVEFLQFYFDFYITEALPSVFIEEV